MSDTPWPSLGDFAATRKDRVEARPAWVHPVEPPLAFIAESREVEDLLDTVVALQRAEWLQDGVWLGPRSMADAWRDLVFAARTLDVPLPPAVVSAASSRNQGAFGTDGRAFLHLSSFFLADAPEAERRFVIGQVMGAVAAHHVTWATLRALLVDQGGLRAVASRALGPALEIVLAPVSLGARLWLNGWHRAAEITSDRAGLVVCGDLQAAKRAMLRQALGVRPKVDPDEYLAQVDAMRDDDDPGRFAEALEDRPWTWKRMRALELFARSEVWTATGHIAIGAPLLSAGELRIATDGLLRVGR